MYITIKQADPILASYGWTSATEDSKTEALNLATQRIELIPFRNEPQHRPRYTDGNITGSTTEPIPEQLKILVAYLAEWYRLNPEVDFNPVLKDVDQSLSPALSDLPLSLQSGLWPFVDAELLAGIREADFSERSPHSDQALSIVASGEEHLFNTLSLGPFPLSLGGNFLGLGGRR